MEYQTQLLLVMISYLGLLIVWRIYQGRKVKTNVDYAIAGRSLPGWVAVETVIDEHVVREMIPALNVFVLW